MADGVLTARKLGSIVADVTIEEDHADEMVITEHPVEHGAEIADHAFKRPATLNLRLGWSNASVQAGGSDQYVRDVYAKLIALQVARTPIDVTTGKRAYTDMLLRSVRLTTDEATEYALFVTVTCQQIIIAKTSNVSVPSAADQANPKKTAPTLNNGIKQPQPVGGFVGSL